MTKFFCFPKVYVGTFNCYYKSSIFIVSPSSRFFYVSFLWGANWTLIATSVLLELDYICTELGLMVLKVDYVREY